MAEQHLPQLYGSASIEPAGEVVAGSYGTWRLTYTVGETGLATGGAIRISTDSDTDWGFPQFLDPSAPDYMLVEAPFGACLQVMAQTMRHLLIVNKGRRLASGEKITLVYGDRQKGSRGSRAQTFQETHRYFWVSVDTDGQGSFTRLPDSPFLTLVGGSAVKLVAIIPSTVVRGAPFQLLVRAEDCWGNPARAYTGQVRLQPEAIQVPVEQYSFTPADGGVHIFAGCVCLRPGIHRISVSDAQAGLSTLSNPLLCRAEIDAYNLYWGEPHGGQLVMAEKIGDFFRYARDVAGADFVGYQRNDHELSNRDWSLQQQAEMEFYQPGRFVPLPGFEWSGETEQGGDHNIYFRRHNQPIRRSSQNMLPEQSQPETDLPLITDVYQAYRLSDVIITPHVGGRTADLAYHAPDLEPVIEVTSTHGSFEWFLREALQLGYQVGFVGGSDGYTGRPGNEYPGHQERRYAKGGLTATYAEDLTINGILDSLAARRCYATTGARILVQMEADGYPIGARYRARGPVSIQARVAGTAPLEKVELYRGLQRIHNHPVRLNPMLGRVRVLWEGASRRTSYSGIVWEGSLRANAGRITSFQQLRFDSPRSWAKLEGEPAWLRWHSVACGYPSGLVLDLQGGPDVGLSLAIESALITPALFGGHGDRGPRRMSYSQAERLAFSFRPADLASGPIVLDLGSLERRVILSLAPEPGNGTMDADISFTDPNPAPGINPYWLRVVQQDMEMAWVSPIFVEYLESSP